VARRKKSYRFPWREGNGFRLLDDGGRFFPAMLDAIEHARHTTVLEMYLFQSGSVATRFIGALVRAAHRGVQVQVLLDGFGSRKLSRRDQQQLSTAGVQLAFYNPLQWRKLYRNLLRDHRKLLVVDGTKAFVGGVGITDMFDPHTAGPRHWHDTVVEITGPCVPDWLALFADNWRRWARTPPVEAPPGEPAAVGTRRGRVTFTTGWPYTEIRRSYLNRMRSARERIWLVTAYFVPARKLRRALRRAAEAGLDVRLLLPGPHTDHPAVRHAGRRFYTRLLSHGVRIFEYQPSFLHSKALLCDRWVSIGSSNGDRWNLRWNLEGNQEVADREFTDQVQAMIEADFIQSREITYSEWRLRPWYLRFAERFWGGVDRWLEKRPRQRLGN
jgi:cardiolipin synthase A/B